MIEYKKNFINFEKTFDFNELTNLIDRNGFQSEFTSDNVNKNYILECPIKIKNVESDSFFNNIYFFLNKEHNIKNLKTNIFLFFSFTGGGKSLAHKDEENVIIIGLYGKTMYIIKDKEYLIEKGDLIKIPKGIVHRAVGLSPRIILSFGIYN
jgi:ribosomal protein L16 Arg81 hydroxylase